MNISFLFMALFVVMMVKTFVTVTAAPSVEIGEISEDTLEKGSLLSSFEFEKKHIMPMFESTKTLDVMTPTKVKRQSESDPIKYKGGRVMTGSIIIYNIFYGNWNSTQTGLLNTLASSIFDSSYFEAEKTYTDVKGTPINGPVSLGGSYVMSSQSYGTSLSDGILPKIVQTSIKNANWPTSKNSIYFINTSNNIKETSGFCSSYCGFHTTSNINGVSKVPFAFIGNPSGSKSCMKGCSPHNQQNSPNDDIGVDAMASIYSHELMEALSDPDGDAWYDDKGEENADKCAYQYGDMKTLENGAYYNEVIGEKNWLIQMNWNANTQACQQ